MLVQFEHGTRYVFLFVSLHYRVKCVQRDEIARKLRHLVDHLRGVLKLGLEELGPGEHAPVVESF
jgi:hypothetical protein